MVEKKYNINELLEKKKHLDEQIGEKLDVEGKDLTYVEETIIDRTNPKNNRKNIPRKRIDLKKFSQVVNGYVDELAKVKTAVQKYNSGEVSTLLQKRESVRTKIQYLKNIKDVLPRDMQKGRNVLSQDANNIPIEVLEATNEPMFELSKVETQLNEYCAEERKLNTEIQKLNLNAKITL